MMRTFMPVLADLRFVFDTGSDSDEVNTVYPVVGV